MDLRRRTLLFSVLALGLMLDILFWRQAVGLNFVLYVVLCVGVGVALLRTSGVQLSGRAAWLIPLILLLASAVFFRAEPLTAALGVLLSLFLMAVLAMTFVGGRWLQYNFADYALGLLRLGWSTLSQPFSFLSRRAEPSRRGGENAWSVARGIIIALPVVLLFAALLGSADLVFQKGLDDFVQLLSLQRLPEYIFRLIYILVAAGALLGVYMHAASRSTDANVTGTGRSTAPRLLGFTEASIVLGSVALLFAAFVFVQVRYFFGGEANIGLDGFTYAEYARRGYGELLAVAFFSLLLILGLGAVTRRDSAARERAFSYLSVVIVAFVGVMLVSAYMRLMLYEQAYGFSRLRTYVHVSLVWLALLLIAVAVLELSRRAGYSAAAALIAACGFALSLSVLNVDAFIVKQNVARAAHGAELDVPYLVSLSDDSVPPLVERFGSRALPAQLHEQLGAALSCRLNAPGPETLRGWRGLTLPALRADASLAAVEPALADYRFVEEDWFGRVVTPAGESILCAQYWD